jgi:protein-tyrosine phosphatase
VSSPFIADAGGLPIDRGAIPRGRLLRVSGDLVALAELRVLKDAGVRSYIDLRGETEDTRRLSRWARRARIDYVSIPIGVAGGKDLMRRVVLGGGNTAGMLALYRAIVDGYGSEMARAVDVIASGTPVAFGCAAGKDRTGVLAALVQSVLGAADEDIAASYVTSAPPIDDFARVLRDEYDVPAWVLRLRGARVMLGATAPTILETLAYVRREYGSAEAYLLAHGLPADSVARLRAELTT